MGLFERIFRIGKSEVNAAVDKLEDPVKLADQVLRELRENYQQAIQGQAEVKAIALQHRAEEQKERAKASEWENKANDLLDMVDTGKLDSAKGHELAEKAAEAYQQSSHRADEFATMANKEDQALDVMSTAIKQLKDKISETENKINLLKSRAKTAAVSEKINKTLSNVDTDGLMSTLDRMDAKVTAQEFRSEAYAEVRDTSLSTEQEINKILKTSTGTSALDAIRAKRLENKPPIIRIN
ncbi:PspA/IM30 family protein [Parasediminibacterium sp. JCM 36343]|uniref:PspA/IM30 family protein n=1 Tax=Parasediminibacterium sp. JCM 36343 TaxID=3374279 RepID=UPI003978CFAB